MESPRVKERREAREAQEARRARHECESKRRYPDEITAMAGAAYCLEERPGVKRLWTYQCSRCHGWHLTRFPNPSKPPIEVTP